MSGYLLNSDSSVMCSHGGDAQPGVTNFRVKVDGKPTVAISSTYMISGCALPPPIVANGPCVTASFTSGTTRVKSNGKMLLFKTSSATCTPTGTPLQIANTQTKVKAQ